MTAMLLRHRLLALLALLTLTGLAACDDGGSGDESPTDTQLADTDTAPDVSEDDTTPDVTPDTTAPQLLAVRVTVPGEDALDLAEGDAEHVASAPVELGFEVSAEDDVTALADLVVTPTSPDGTPLETLGASEVVDGAWVFMVSAAPGDTIHVAVTDEAGNTTQSEHAVVIRSHADAIAGTWATRFYDVDQQVTSTVTTTYGDDGTYTTTNDSTGLTTTGDWSIDDEGLFVLEQRTSTEGNSDPTTIELVTRGAYHLDETYFSTRPLQLQGASTGAVGTWVSQVTITQQTGPSPGELVATRTLVLGDDDTFTDTLDGGVSQNTKSGTWAIETGANGGEFLVRTVTMDRGAAVDPPEIVTELVATTPQVFLISPAVRAE